MTTSRMKIDHSWVETGLDISQLFSTKLQLLSKAGTWGPVL